MAAGIPIAVQLAGPALGFAGSLISGLLGKHSTDKASVAQAKAQAEAIALERQRLGMDTAAQQYALNRSQALDSRSMQMRNAMLRGMGVTGVEDPSVNWDAINAPPPDLMAAGRPWMQGMPAQPAMTLGQLARLTGQPSTMPGQPQMGVPAPVASPMRAPEMTLGSLFRMAKARRPAGKTA